MLVPDTYQKLSSVSPGVHNAGMVGKMLRIDNRRLGTFWWRHGIIPLMVYYMYHIHFIILLYGLFIDIKHVKIAWTDTILF